MSFQEPSNFTDVHGIISSTRLLGFYADTLTRKNHVTNAKPIIF